MKIRNNVALSDSGFLFNPSSGDSYSLNETGLFIVHCLQNNKSEDEIIKEVTKEYMIEKGSFEKDFYDFKKLMESFNLID